MAGRLASLGHQVTVHDPHADAAEAMHEYGVALDPDALTNRYDLVVLAVPHRAYRDLGPDRLVGLVAEGGLFADLKGIVPSAALTSVKSWSL